MTFAETALRNFARINRLRLSKCSFYNPNVGERAFKQAKVRKGQLVATVRAADSYLDCEVKLADREFGFAVNRLTSSVS